MRTATALPVPLRGARSTAQPVIHGRRPKPSMFLAFVAAVVLLVGPAAMAVLSLTAPDLFGRLAQIDPLSATAALLSFFSWFKWPLWAITVALLGLIELARGIRFAP